MNGGFTDEQKRELAAIVEQGVRRGFADAGLRTDEADQIDEARRDFAFVRSLRKGVNGAASKIGWAVIMAVLGAIFWLFNSGLQFWKGQ
jgi:hypothetical protein